MDFLIEPERRTTVTDEAEVVVAGGGPAGVAAAIASARLGAKTMLVERYGHLGGMATGGLIITLCETKRYGMGVEREMVERLEAIGGARLRRAADSENVWTDGASFSGDEWINIDPELLKFVLNEMVLEAGVDLIMHSCFVGVNMEGPFIRHLILEDKSGRHAVSGKMFVDATGDADVAAAAGAPFEYKRHPWGINIDYRFGGVDIDKEARFRKERPSDHEKILEKLKELVGGRMYWGPSVRDGIVWGGAPHDREADGLNPRHLTRVEVEGRRALVKGMGFLRKNMPGLEDVFILDTSSQTGIRETRRILGEYILTKEDELSGRKFKDAVVSSLFDIPYRCLVPRKVQNLLVGGRCISTSHEAHGPTRNIPPCMVTGQAAGTAAALSLKYDTEPSLLDPEKIRESLKEQGFKYPN